MMSASSIVTDGQVASFRRYGAATYRPLPDLPMSGLRGRALPGGARAERIETRVYDPRGVILAVSNGAWVGMAATSYPVARPPVGRRSSVPASRPDLLVPRRGMGRRLQTIGVSETATVSRTGGGDTAATGSINSN